MAQLTLTIFAVEKKKGRDGKILEGSTKDGKHWIIYQIIGHAPDHSRVTGDTVDAEWGKHIGETVTVSATQDKYGYRFGNYRDNVQAVTSAPAPAAAPSRNGSDKFEILSAKLDAVLENLLAIRKHFAE